MELTTPDNALATYEKIKDARKLIITMERGGVPVTLKYHIE